MTPNSEKITQEIGGFPKGKYSPKAGKRYFFDSKPEEEEVDRQKGCLLYPLPLSFLVGFFGAGFFGCIFAGCFQATLDIVDFDRFVQFGQLLDS